MDKTVAVIGLGKMGKNVALQLLSKGYKVVAANRSPEPINELKQSGAAPAYSFEEAVKLLAPPRIVWIMVPPEAVDEVIEKIKPHTQSGDTIIDAGNSNYKESARRHKELLQRGIHFLDAGCSGGPSGARNGMCIMVGGDEEIFKALEPLFKDVSVPEGVEYTGPAGSGHFVKMVHNAIEYGMMQSIGEGFELLEQGPYKGLDLRKIAYLWNRGSVVRSYLVELVERALSKDPKLENIEGFVEDTGEGRWATQAAIEHGVPFTGLSHALFARFRSRKDSFSDKVLAALRNEFGGHAVKAKNKEAKS
ncbi:MAG: decarboxylating 6-phosphogluconate dehydrogenase [Candidatus Aenigmarchaeota archaeon]|nr:decarboxylating 6-phosphogluconate dehydrogenase [Candidatus Aenigmarchaeota archaeon]